MTLPSYIPADCYYLGKNPDEPCWGQVRPWDDEAVICEGHTGDHRQERYRPPPKAPAKSEE